MSSNSGRNTIITGVNIWGSGPVLSDLRVSGNTILNALQVLSTAIFNGIVTFFSNVIFKGAVSFTTLPTSSQLTPNQANQLVTKNYVDSTVISGELDIFNNNNTWTNTNTWEDNSYFEGEVKFTKSCLFDLDADEIVRIGTHTNPVANFLATTTTFTIAATGSASIAGSVVDISGAIVDIQGGGYIIPVVSGYIPVGGYFKIQPLATTVHSGRSLFLESIDSYHSSSSSISMGAPTITIGSLVSPNPLIPSNTYLLGNSVQIGSGFAGTDIVSQGEIKLKSASIAEIRVYGNAINLDTLTDGQTAVGSINQNTLVSFLKAKTITRTDGALTAGTILDESGQITMKAATLFYLQSNGSLYVGNNTGGRTPSVVVEATKAEVKGPNVELDASVALLLQSPKIDVKGSTTVDVQAPDIDITATGALTSKAPKIDITGSATVDVKAPDIDITATASIKHVAPKIDLNGSVTLDLKSADIDLEGVTSITLTAPTMKILGGATTDITAADIDISATTSITQAAPDINLNAGVTVDVNAPNVNINGTAVDIDSGTLDMTGTAKIKQSSNMIELLATTNIKLNSSTVDINSSDLDINTTGEIKVNAPIFTTSVAGFERLKIVGNAGRFTGGSFDLFFGP